MYNPSFDDAVYVQKVNSFNTAIEVGEFPASGSYIDVSGFERFVFLILAGTLDTALVCQVQQATAVNGTAKDITGATVTVGASDDNKWHSIEVQTAKLDANNDYRYVTLDITGAAGSNDYLCIVFLGFYPGEQPVTQHASYVSAVVVAG